MLNFLRHRQSKSEVGCNYHNKSTQLRELIIAFQASPSLPTIQPVQYLVVHSLFRRSSHANTAVGDFTAARAINAPPRQPYRVISRKEKTSPNYLQRRLMETLSEGSCIYSLTRFRGLTE